MANAALFINPGESNMGRKNKSEEITPQNDHARKIIKEDLKRKEEIVIVETKYVIRNNKLLEVSRTSNGNKHRRFIGNMKKPMVTAFAKKLESEGHKIGTEY